MVKLPTNDLPRFIQLPKIDGLHHIMFIDDIIRYNLQELFPGYEISGAWSVKLARDADLGIDDEFSGNLVEKIKKNLVRRNTGLPASFHHDREIDADLLQFLMETFDFSRSELVEAGRYLNLHDFFKFPNPYAPLLEWHTPAPIRPMDMEANGSVFAAIKEREHILHYPYHSFDYVIKFLNEAAIDPKVEEIKVTQYRVATNSAVVNSLIAAARNHKKVTVFVEVKARFDEENNLHFAEIMKAAGIKIIYSIPGLKVHAKMALVIRKANGIRKRSFAYLSTGNFNEKTARQYADHGYFTCKDEIIEDMEKLFTYLEDQAKRPKLNKLLVTQINFKTTIMKKINHEIELAKDGRQGYILLKMNGIQNKLLINKLYEASQAGVKIDMIVRGICCLVPNQTYSSNIRLIRLVDSYLEHARVWVFGNNGDKEMYLSSADWLNRNINRRIETAFPIEEEQLKDEILKILDLQLNDNTKVRLIDEQLRNIMPEGAPSRPIRAQHDTYAWLLDQKPTIKTKINCQQMKKLILIRHSKTENLVAGQNDYFRALKPRGESDALLIAEKLKEHGIGPDLIISSPAKRAVQTAQIFAQAFNYQKERVELQQFIYDGYTSGEFVSFLNQQPDEKGQIFIIGHNPEIAMLAINLTDGNFFHFPTTAAVVINFDTQSWKDVNSREGKTELFIYPKQFKSSASDD
jgi:Polyphosphate kinase